MPLLAYSYWGICWYLRNASCQSASVSGGSMPMIGFHSVIERPQPGSRVAPPRLTMASTKAATAKSQTRTGAKLWAEPAMGGEDAFAMAAVIVGFAGLWHAALRRSGLSGRVP